MQLVFEAFHMLAPRHCAVRLKGPSNGHALVAWSSVLLLLDLDIVSNPPEKHCVGSSDITPIANSESKPSGKKHVC